jgi:hypothetical protein
MSFAPKVLALSVAAPVFPLVNVMTYRSLAVYALGVGVAVVV